MSIKLSDLINNVIGDIHSDPKEIEMQTIANAVERVMGADVILRKQIELRMTHYTKKYVADGEMLNCLTLTNFLVQNSPTFRTQVAEYSFIKLFQQIGKMNKHYEECNDVEDKVRELITIWATYYPNELSEYRVLHKKYVSLNVIDPLTQPVTYLPSPIFSLIPHVEHNLRNISRAIESRSGDLESIYNFAQKLNLRFTAECQKCRENVNRYDIDELQEAERLGKRLTDNLAVLKNIIDGKNRSGVQSFKPIVIKQHPTTQDNTENVFKSRIGRRMPATSMTPSSMNIKMKGKPKGRQDLLSHSFVLTQNDGTDSDDLDSGKEEDDDIEKRDDDFMENSIRPRNGNQFTFNLKYQAQTTTDMDKSPEDVFSFDDD